MNKIIATVMGFVFASSIASAAATQSKAKVEEEAKKEESKFGMSFVSEMNLGMTSAHNGEADDIGSINIIAPSFKLSETETISVGLVFGTSRLGMENDPLLSTLGVSASEKTRLQQKATSEGAKPDDKPKTTFRNSQQFTAGSPYIKYSNSKVEVFGEEISASGRLYVPGSEKAQLSGVFVARGDFGLEKVINDTWTADYSWSPRYYMPTKEVAGVISYDGLYSAGLSQKLTESISASYSTMFRHQFYNKGKKLTLGSLNPDGTRNPATREAGEDNNQNFLYLTVGAKFALNESLSVTTYLEHKRGLDDKTQTALNFKEADSLYGLLIQASL